MCLNLCQGLAQQTCDMEDRFQKDLAVSIQDIHKASKEARRFLKKLRKQYHIESLSWTGDRMYFDSSGDLVDFEQTELGCHDSNSGKYAYKVDYWHFVDGRKETFYWVFN